MSTSKSNINNIEDKILGALYGFAIGDAMGATTEFMDRDKIKFVYGQVNDLIGGGWLNTKPGQVTDDTQMTLCVSNAIIDAKLNDTSVMENIRTNFIEWVNSNPPDIGVQCRSGIYQLILGNKFAKKTAGAGNGSLMRALPFALLGPEHFEMNVLQGRLTHNNETCDTILMNYSNLIWNYIIPHGKIYGQEIGSHLEPSGYIINTYQNALYWANNYDFKECIIHAVNDGGDADTIAAIAGSLSGARYGFGKIPVKWIIGLDNDVKDELNKFAKFAKSYLQSYHNML